MLKLFRLSRPKAAELMDRLDELVMYKAEVESLRSLLATEEAQKVLEAARQLELLEPQCNEQSLCNLQGHYRRSLSFRHISYLNID